MSAGGRPQPDLLDTGKPIAVITGLLGLKASGAARH